MYLQNLQQDEIFVPSEMKSLKSLTQMESRRGLENAIISNGKIVNVVSNSYGHIPNQLFFKKAEEMLTDAQLNFHKRTINKNDRSFITDFIIDDKSQFTVKNAKDLILPMLRFKNSYDGSEKTSGHLGFYRKVCSNGLHVSQVEIEFSIKHSKNNTHLIMPRLKNLFDKFLTNEFYTITKNFDKMKEFKIIDIQEFVKAILHRTKLFRYECSDKNSAPSKKSREVIEILNYEALLLNEEPNLWLGYNAFNSVLHNVLKKSFGQQERLDKKLLMKSMLSHKINKGLSSTSNWMAKYITDGYTQTHSAHSPAIREKLHNGQRASLERSWTQSPISAFHSVNPSRHAGKEHYIPEPKS